MTEEKVAVGKAELRIKSYPIISRAIEEGIELGWNRSHKHTDTPDPETVKDAIGRAIMERLDEVVDFGDQDF